MPIARPELHLMISGAAIYCARVLSSTLKVERSKPWLRSDGERTRLRGFPFDREGVLETRICMNVRMRAARHLRHSPRTTPYCVLNLLTRFGWA